MVYLKSSINMLFETTPDLVHECTDLDFSRANNTTACLF